MNSIQLARLEARRARQAALNYQHCRTVALPAANKLGSKIFKAGVMRRLNRFAAEYRRARDAARSHLAAHQAEKHGSGAGMVHLRLVVAKPLSTVPAKHLSDEAAEFQRRWPLCYDVLSDMGLRG